MNPVVRLQFVLGSGLSSRAISYFGAGGYSHVDVVLRDGTLLGARSDEILGIVPGVRIRPQGYEDWKKRTVMTLAVTEQQEKDFLDFVVLQIGKPYDSTAIWGFAAGRDWREKDSWFCSELAGAATESAGIVPTLIAPTCKITPGALATVYSAIGATWDKARLDL